LKTAIEWAWVSFDPLSDGDNRRTSYAATLLTLRRVTKKFHRERKRSEGSKDLHVLVAAGRLPPDGLSQLREAVRADFNRQRALSINELRMEKQYYQACGN